MNPAELKSLIIATLISNGSRGEDDYEYATQAADKIIALGQKGIKKFKPKSVADYSAVAFADTIISDLATDMDGDPDKMRAYWKIIRSIVDKETS